MGATMTMRVTLKNKKTSIGEKSIPPRVGSNRRAGASIGSAIARAMFNIGWYICGAIQLAIKLIIIAMKKRSMQEFSSSAIDLVKSFR